MGFLVIFFPLEIVGYTVHKINTNASYFVYANLKCNIVCMKIKCNFSSEVPLVKLMEK